MKLNGAVELRRSYEELTSAYRVLEDENRRLRAECERLKTGAGAKPVPARVRVNAEPAPGQFVEYLPSGGKDGTVPHDALVLENLGGGRLKLKVLRFAQPDIVLEDVPKERWRRRRHG